MVILALETSCDETAAAVLRLNVKGKFPAITTLSSVVKSQISLHSRMGGVVPETAARAHVQNILPVTEKALLDAGTKLENIDAIAVTAGPGLIPSLIVGVEFAKALAFATDKPVIPVNHMEGHLYSPFGGVNDKIQISNAKQLFPQVALIVSGGHTILVLMENERKYRVLGQTVDDAAGEAFDKVAKLLKLPYPGGPEVSKLALEGSAAAINFPRPMLHSKDYNFSFAGLKTAVLYFIKDQGPRMKDIRLHADICASFQQAVIDVLVAKTMRAASDFKAKTVSLSGGVSANRLLRDTLQTTCRERQLELFVPPFVLSTDNAEMIGIAAAFKLHRGFAPIDPATVKADPNLSL